MAIKDSFSFKKDSSIVFIGKDLQIKISKRYENYKLLEVRDTVNTIAIFDMVIDGKKCGMLLPAVVEMCPTDTATITEGNDTYVLCTFKKGDVFIKNRNIVKNKHLAYVIFTEFVEKGKMPEFLKYNDYAFVLDIAQDICGLSIPANHVAFEIIYSFLSRKHDDYTVLYRLTNMLQPPMFLRLSDAAHASTSVTSKLIGSYLADSINAAIVNESDNSSKVEDVLRQ